MYKSTSGNDTARARDVWGRDVDCFSDGTGNGEWLPFSMSTSIG